MRDSKMVGAGTDQESIVDCGTFDPMGGGIFQFGLVLVASSTAVIERLWSKFDFISQEKINELSASPLLFQKKSYIGHRTNY